VYGDYYSTGGIYQESVSIDGQDTLIAFMVEILSIYTTYVKSEIIAGDSIFLEDDYQTQEGLYYDTLATQYGCDSVVATNVKFSLITGLDNYPQTGEILLYPNPSNQEIHLEYDLNRAQNVQILIYDIFGKEMIDTGPWFQNAGKQKVTQNVSHLPAGIYLVVLRSRSGIRKVRFLKGG